MLRTILLALALAAGAPHLGSLLDVVVKAGNNLDPNGATGEAGNHLDPDGATTEARSSADPNGATGEAGNHLDPNG